MKHYKWCVCDMDGTLLNSMDTISQEDEAALKELKNYNIEVMIASGRLDLMIKRYIRQLDLHGYTISCNGGLIRNLTTGELVYSNAMDKEIVSDIITDCFADQIDFLIYTPEAVLANHDNPRADRYVTMNEYQPEDLRVKISFIDKADCKELLGVDILKILLLPSKELVEAYINRYQRFTKLEVVSSAPGLVDIMASGSSKGNALQILATKKKVDPSEIIAFGDHYNDIELLQTAGMPIAMENAVAELKTIAKYVTKSNDNAGIAYAIKNYILTK